MYHRSKAYHIKAQEKREIKWIKGNTQLQQLQLQLLSLNMIYDLILNFKEKQYDKTSMFFFNMSVFISLQSNPNTQK